MPRTPPTGRKNKEASSKYLGVFVNKRLYAGQEYKYYTAIVYLPGRKRLRRTFPFILGNEEEAAVWRDIQAFRHYGEKAVLNFPLFPLIYKSDYYTNPL